MTADADRWKQIDTIFAQALERPGEERTAFLEAACGGDDALRAEVEALLEASRASDEYWADSGRTMVGRVWSAIAPDSATADVSDPETIASYRVLRRIGRGGMGSVFLAERADGAYEQRVAIKLLRPGVDTGDVIRRFLAERQILASLEHPGIARLLDGGTARDALPFLVMEYVDGRPITEHCDAVEATIEERLRLFEEVAGAVEHAHRHLVVHRDLKPSNILVTEAGEVKLLDFGIAKLLDETDPESGSHTRTGARLMTPGYASPEQVEGDTVTTASDIYQLGLLLYELLTGTRAFGSDEISRRELERRILEDAPERPSRRSGRKALAGDLDDIVLKALRREPEGRYRSVGELLADLEAHRAGRPIAASAGAWRYRARKFVRRHRVGVAAAAAFLVVIVGSLVAVEIQRERAVGAAALAEREAETARQVTAFIADVFGGSDPEQTLGDSVTARTLLERGAERIETELADQPEVRAELLRVIGNVYTSLGSYDPAVELHEASVALRRELYGAEHEKLAESLHALANTHRAGRNPQLAEPLYREALNMHRAVLGPDSPGAASSALGLAQALRDLGRADTATVLMREVLDIYRLDPGPESREYIGALSALAVVLRASGDSDEAERLYRELIDRRRERAGDSREAMATDLNNLAYLLRLRGEFAEAAELYRESLDLLESTYGRGHPNTLMVAGNLAVTLELTGAFAAADSIKQESVRAAEERWPAGHWRVGSEYLGLGVVRASAGDYSGARAPLLEAARIYETTIGPTHSWTARAWLWYAAVASLRGETEAADTLFDTSFTTLRIQVESNGLPAYERTALEFAYEFMAERGLAEAAELRAILDMAPAASG